MNGSRAIAILMAGILKLVSERGGTLNKYLVALAFLAMLLLINFTLIDRYPTVRDCLTGVDNYIDRGIFPGDVAIEYRQLCQEAESREARNDIVRTMNDDASIRASQG